MTRLMDNERRVGEWSENLFVVDGPERGSRVR